MSFCRHWIKSAKVTECNLSASMFEHDLSVPLLDETFDFGKEGGLTNVPNVPEDRNGTDRLTFKPHLLPTLHAPPTPP